MSTVTAIEAAVVPVKKGILRTIRVFLQNILHYILLPLVAVCKALAAFFTHLDTDLSKIELLTL